MTEKTCWESFRGGERQRVSEAEAADPRRQRPPRAHPAGSRTVAEFPLTAGVVGAVVAPTLAAIGALVALIKDCSIDVERVETSAATPDVARGGQRIVPAEDQSSAIDCRSLRSLRSARCSWKGAHARRLQVGDPPYKKRAADSRQQAC
jgi:hypothetical protein